MKNTEAKEKAEELIERIFHLKDLSIYIFQDEMESEVKQIALFVVDEILSLLPLVNRDFWQEVKQEIEKL